MRNSRQRFRVRLPKPFSDPQILGFLIIFQLVTLLLLLLTGPSSITLSFVAPFDEVNYWAPLIENFEKQHPGIQIELLDDPEVTDTTDNVEVIYSADLQKDSPRYDLVYMDVIWVPGFAEKGWLKELSDFISAEELSEFVLSEVDAGRYRNRLYRIPFRADVGVLFYNQRLLEAGGYQLSEDLPNSLGELADISEDLQNRKIAEWGYLWQGGRYEGLIATFVEVLDSYGGFWIDPTKDNRDQEKVGLDQDAALAAVKFLRDIITPGESASEAERFEANKKISPSSVRFFREQQSLDQFALGKTAFLRGWHYFWQRANQARAHLKGEFEIIPASDYNGRGCRGGWGFGIAKNTKHPKEAWQAIQYFTSEAAQRQFVLNAGYLPSRKHLFEDAAILQQYPHFSKLLQMLEAKSIFRPQIPDYDRASQILQDHLWKVLVGEQTPEKAMQQAATETRELLIQSN